MLLSGRLLRSSGLSQMVPDPAFHDLESGPDCRGFHAHGVGAVDLDLCHSASAGIGIDLRGYYGIRGGLHALYQVEFFRDGPVRVEVKSTRQVSHGRPHPSWWALRHSHIRLVNRLMSRFSDAVWR